MSAPLRFAVIGTGFFAQNHLHAWAEIPDVELVAVCDTDPERLAAAARDFGGTPYSDARELFANEELDFVDIATTPPTHPMMVHLAAEHGVGHALGNNCHLGRCELKLAHVTADREA